MRPGNEETASDLVKLVNANPPIEPRETVDMKCSKAAVHRKTHRIPELKFEDQRLTSFAGLVVFQALFRELDLKARLGGCFHHLPGSPSYSYAVVVLLLVVHLLLGYRRLQDIRYYQDDPLVGRVLGLSRWPDVATLSRALAVMDAESVERLHRSIAELTDLPVRWLLNPHWHSDHTQGNSVWRRISTAGSRGGQRPTHS